jgi:mRNA-degrading endonuclease RelE of RelBE toxin-antitoxin system
VEQSLDDWPDSDYVLARIRYEFVLAPEALEDFRELSTRDRAIVRDALETHLRHEPAEVSRSRIKRLRGRERPQYRLRIEDRVFYDVVGRTVEVLAIVVKTKAAEWLARLGREP